MRVRLFWRDCDYRNKSWGADAIDAFWVEATQEEAIARVFPLLQPEQIAESLKIAEECRGVAAMMGNADHTFCFLVARDLSSIDPFPPHYPVHQMWNAYSPFEPMPDMTVESLDALRDIALPPKPADSLKQE